MHIRSQPRHYRYFHLCCRRNVRFVRSSSRAVEKNTPVRRLREQVLQRVSETVPCSYILLQYLEFYPRALHIGQ